jgi:hypothetical protein
VVDVSLVTKRLKWTCESGWGKETAKRFTGKAMKQVYQCWWRICREIFFFKLEYHMFYVLYPFVTYLLTLPRTELPYPGGKFACWEVHVEVAWNYSTDLRTSLIC